MSEKKLSALITRVPDSMKKRFEIVAEKERRTVSQLLRIMIEDKIKQFKTTRP